MIAKIAEKFVSILMIFYDIHADINQFGYVHNESTPHSLLKVMHEIFVASDVSENIIRILFVDFRKVFDLIDHNVLFNKLLSSGVPEHVCMYVCIREFITREFLQPKQSRVRARRPY